MHGVKKLVRVSGGNYTSTSYIDGVFEELTDGTDTQNTLHVMDDKSRVATFRLGEAFGDTTPALKYVLEDHLGNSSFEINSDGTFITKEEYYPYGETSFASYSKKRYKYNGKERDEESGMYYYGKRYYSAWSCRFISVDPLYRDYAYYTPYQFAGNKPVSSIDLDGLEEVTQVPNTAEGQSGPTGPAAAVGAEGVEGPNGPTGPKDLTVGWCEGCEVIGLEDGDYLSDVQNQVYIANFKGVTREDYENLKTQFITDPGLVNDNLIADYELVDRDESGGVSVNDHVDIGIGAPGLGVSVDDSSVIVQDVAANDTGFMAKFATLDGHSDAGWIFFAAFYNESEGTLTYRINNTTRTNTHMSAIGGPLVSRVMQQLQWKIVLSNVADILGKKPTSASMYKAEYDYNDWTNKMSTTPEWEETKDITNFVTRLMR